MKKYLFILLTILIPLNVFAVVSISSEPATTLTVSEGNNITLSVTATGAGDLSYQWKYGTTGIYGATTESLTITRFYKENEGFYYVTITDDDGSVDSTGTTVTLSNTTPVLVAQSLSKTVEEGADVTFNVSASGDDLKYQWYKNGNAITDEETASLLLEDVVATDKGSYTCKIYNIAGSVDTNEMKLRVLE